jgi:hypothetical protein
MNHGVNYLPWDTSSPPCELSRCQCSRVASASGSPEHSQLCAFSISRAPLPCANMTEWDEVNQNIVHRSRGIFLSNAHIHTCVRLTLCSNKSSLSQHKSFASSLFSLKYFRIRSRHGRPSADPRDQTDLSRCRMPNVLSFRPVLH